MIDELFGPLQHYKCRCSVCETEIEINEAVIDAEIGMAKFNNDYDEGYMPKLGCPECNNYTMEYTEKDKD